MPYVVPPLTGWADVCTLSFPSRRRTIDAIASHWMDEIVREALGLVLRAMPSSRPGSRSRSDLPCGSSSRDAQRRSLDERRAGPVGRLDVDAGGSRGRVPPVYATSRSSFGRAIM